MRNISLLLCTYMTLVLTNSITTPTPAISDPALCTDNSTAIASITVGKVQDCDHAVHSHDCDHIYIVEDASHMHHNVSLDKLCCAACREIAYLIACPSVEDICSSKEECGNFCPCPICVSTTMEITLSAFLIMIGGMFVIGCCWRSCYRLLNFAHAKKGVRRKSLFNLRSERELVRRSQLNLVASDITGEMNREYLQSQDTEMEIVHDGQIQFAKIDTGKISIFSEAIGEKNETKGTGNSPKE